MQETQEMGVQSLGGEDSLEEEMATHSRILAWRVHGQRSLVGYSPWGREESDTTWQLSTQKTHRSRAGVRNERFVGEP